VPEEASAAGVKKQVFESSASIYGDNPTVPKLENHAARTEEPARWIFQKHQLTGSHFQVPITISQ
jgi:nucleoside-diphosphate-sugar epimerase